MLMILCRCKGTKQRKSLSTADPTMAGTNGPRNETFILRKKSESQVGNWKTCSNSNIRIENETPRGRPS